MYDVIVRNHWKERPDRPGCLIPDLDGNPKKIYSTINEVEAQLITRRYNLSHEPGRFVRSAEYMPTQVNVPYLGYTNWYTWNIAIWLEVDANEQYLDAWLFKEYPGDPNNHGRIDPTVFYAFVVNNMFPATGLASEVKASEMLYVNWIELAEYTEYRLQENFDMAMNIEPQRRPGT